MRYPVLYILTRTDLQSMGYGKRIAQSVHAGHQFVWDIQNRYPVLDFEEKSADNLNIQEMYRVWAVSAMMTARAQYTPQNMPDPFDLPRGFGVTICLGVNGSELKSVVMVAKAMGFVASITTDPDYPLIDGFTASVDTCGYVFGDKDALFPVVGKFHLHP